MAKSVLHAVVGLLVSDGLIDPAEPPPVPAWSDPADPRRAITWDDLLCMRAGLAWVEEYYDFAADELPDVVTMLYGQGRHDMAGFASGFPLVHRPGSDEAYCYSSGTSNIISAAAGRVLGGGEAVMRAYLAERLFDPLGMRSASPTFDDAGTFVASSYLHATARDWARFGLFVLRDGTWDGERLLPAGWVDHGRTPRSPDENFIHGAHWWAVPGERWGAFCADGFEGQRIYVVPALDLVLVRLGRTHTDHSATMDAHLRDVIACFE
jgi:CubicO group peptidase (beta-lactamase class C family)